MARPIVIGILFLVAILAFFSGAFVLLGKLEVILPAWSLQRRYFAMLSAGFLSVGSIVSAMYLGEYALAMLNQRKLCPQLTTARSRYPLYAALASAIGGLLAVVSLRLG